MSLIPSAPSPWQIAHDRLFPKPNPYLKDPVGWVQERLGEFVWSKQREILQSVVENRYTAVKSAHDTGKSHSASRAVCWWLDVKPDPFGTTTAPTTKQVHAILWRYIGQAHRKADLPGRITLDDEWYTGPGGKELVAFGRKPGDTDQAAFQGLHALYPIIVIDEAAGVVKAIFDAVDALATNLNARVLAIGNPDDPASHFAEVCKPGSGWTVIAVDGLRTPNFTREACEPYPELVAYMQAQGVPYSTEEIPDDLRPLLIDPSWVDERIKRWGTTSPIFTSKVRGQFPDISDDTLIHPRWIEAAQKRSLERNHKPKLAADIARYGEDETAIYRREGGWVRLYRAHRQADTMTTAGHIAKAFKDITAEPDLSDWPSGVVDEVGVGGGVVDRLHELGIEVVGLNAGWAPIDKERFVNAKAEWAWTLREVFERDEIDIDPDDDVLAAQLGSIKWTVDSRGRIKIESKDDMRKRGMPSPDRAEAVMFLYVERFSLPIDVESHQGTGITGDLLQKQW